MNQCLNMHVVWQNVVHHLLLMEQCGAALVAVDGVQVDGAGGRGGVGGGAGQHCDSCDPTCTYEYQIISSGTNSEHVWKISPVAEP
jgi:hypothetical protein